MEDNLNPDQSTSTVKGEQWYHTVTGRVVLLIVIIIGLYFGFTRIKSNYLDKLTPKNIPELTEKSGVIDKTFGDGNQLSTKDSIQASEKAVSQDSSLNMKDSGHVDLFKVNTTYKKIDVESGGGIFTDKKNKGRWVTNDLFETLLIPKVSNDDFNGEMFDQYYLTDFISLKSTLKIIGVVGKQLLSGINTEDNESVLRTIAESDKVRNLIITDSNGGIRYATDQKIINSNILEVFPQIQTDKTTLGWFDLENEAIVTFPLFHTYGRLGMAILIIKTDR